MERIDKYCGSGFSVKSGRFKACECKEKERLEKESYYHLS
jgi:hypothetical protein